MSEEEFEVQYLNTKMQDPAVKLVLEWNCEARCTPTLVTATPLSSLGPTADRDMLEKPGSPPSKTRALAAPACPTPRITPSTSTPMTTTVAPAASSPTVSGLL